DGSSGANLADLREFPRDNPILHERGQAIAALLAKHVDAGRPLGILDVGAGYGHVLHALGARFPAATRTALEPSKACFDHLRALHIEVIPRSLDDALPIDGARFTVLILSHVLEHFLDPRAMLERVRASLEEGGLLYVEVPHIAPGSLLRHPTHPW